MNENPAKYLTVLNKEMRKLKLYGGEIYPIKKINQGNRADAFIC